MTLNVMLVKCSHRLMIHDVTAYQSGVNLSSCVPKGNNLMIAIGLEASIAKSRSFWTTVFYDKHPDYEILAFVDDDMTFKVEDFWKIVYLAKKEKCVVGVPYMKREFPPVAIISKEGGFYFDRGVIEVEGVGTGFMAIHRDVIKSFVADPSIKRVRTGKKDLEGKDILLYYPTFAEIIDGDDWLSEDYGFCRLAKHKYGHKILADTDLDVGHAGVHVFSKKDLFSQQRQ